MTNEEYDFWTDVLDVVNDWDNEAEHYHENGMFCIDVTFDLDDWGENYYEINEALDDLSEEWGFDYDNDCNTYYIAIEFD